MSAPPSTTAPATWADVNRDVIRTIGMPGEKYFALMCLVALTLACGAAAWAWQIWVGIGAAGKRTPQMWAMYITTFVFWIGIGHAGTLISAILYLFRAKWRTSIYRGAEAMTVFAVMTAGLFPLIHLGRMWFFYDLVRCQHAAEGACRPVAYPVCGHQVYCPSPGPMSKSVTFERD